MNEAQPVAQLESTQAPRYSILWVIQNWIRNQSARTKSDSMRTENGKIYSYGLLVGYTENGCKYLLNHTARGLGFVSMTTSQHVGKIDQYCQTYDIPILEGSIE